MKLNNPKLLLAVSGIAIIIFSVSFLAFRKIKEQRRVNNEIVAISEYVSSQPYARFLNLESKTTGEGECYISELSGFCTKVEYDITNKNCDEIKLVFDEEENKRKTPGNLSGEFDKFKKWTIVPIMISGELEDSGEKYCFARFLIE